MQVLPVFNYNFQPKFNPKTHNNATPTFGAHLDKDLFVSIKQKNESLKKKYLTPDDYGGLPIHRANLEKMKEIHNALKDKPEILAKMHLTKNKFRGDLPMHRADLEMTKEIHNALKNQPEVLTIIHLTKNNDGDLPIHLANPDYKYGPMPIHLTDFEIIKEIHNALKKQPEVIAKMHLTKNNDGDLPIHRASRDGKKEIHRAIYEVVTNSDLDLKTSIKLLKTYNFDGRYSDEIETLKRQK